MVKYFTGKGDNGYTGMLGEGRMAKYDLRAETLGAVDETNSALGMARAWSKDPHKIEIILKIQRELYQLMGEVAATPENAERFRAISEQNVAWLESLVEEFGSQVELPKEFIVPGDAPASAAMDLARTATRRAERRMVEFQHKVQNTNPCLLSYLNRLSSLLFIMELHEVRLAGKETPTLAVKK